MQNVLVCNYITYCIKFTADKQVKMTDDNASNCSPSKKRRTENDSSSSSMDNSSESSADEHCSVLASSRTSLSSFIDRCQPLSFFLTTVEGIQSKFNQCRALGIKGKILKYRLLRIFMVLQVYYQYTVYLLCIIFI